ncbi:GspH/FimT family pseudopilin [Marinicauda sp. Alg238-R41]|uniref:GspH/FimT family pseudopilin n=1 Tax=Marinicauda sp. Alg238-R41 TaxID=2993447 RepID=UPI0022E02E15|nr:GspH/FimT family pseudopilin [Marinicauda sp. Alg238-R41]
MMRGLDRSGEAGVSLVEMMVVVAIIAMMASVVTLSVTGRPALVELEAERLLARFLEARETALVTGTLVGFAPDPDAGGYRFVTYRGGSWQDLPDHPALAPRSLADTVRITLDGPAARSDAGRSEADDDPVPHLWFDPTGLDMPFTILLQDARRDVRVVRTGEGALRIESRGAPS